MEMKKIYVIFVICIITLLTSTSWAGQVIPSKDGKVTGGKFGEVYECAFPNTVVIDGSLNELPWDYAPWHTINHDEGTGPATNANDASLLFAAIADKEWLYVAFKVTDDKIVTGEVSGLDLWKDDSVEVYIDANNAGTAAYEKDDAQITIGADNIDLKDIEKPDLGGTGDGPTTGTMVAAVETKNGWIVEAAIPLKNDKWDIKPSDGLIIGFNVHFNDDDDGGDRDHKLIWSLKDVDDLSYSNTSRFADLKFVSAQLAVEPGCKITSTWGQIKQR